MDQFQTEGCQLLTYLIGALVDEPGSVEVKSHMSNDTVVFRIVVSKKDLGKVIGKQGNNIHSVRRILFAFSSKYKQRAVLELVE
ncbi:MAG: KH domain-containing protein [Proteobacteria bacterium]|nr:KH domain-containing protein [Pseudomonadota bacterium]